MPKKVFVTLGCGHVKTLSAGEKAMGPAAKTTCLKCKSSETVVKWH